MCTLTEAEHAEAGNRRSFIETIKLKVKQTGKEGAHGDRFF